jgi:uncharacterized protein YndB with AHSA1/START domain
MKKELYVTASADIEASTDKVWDYLTNPEHTKKYMFGCEAQSTWETGSSLLWKGENEGKEVVFVKGEIVNIIPGKVLQYTVFDPNMGIPDVPENYLTVTFELEENKYSTILTVKQGNFATVEKGKERYKDSEGSWDTLLQKIKELIEEGE